MTLRRLNRAEYRNTIRDLLGIDYPPAAGFPGDDVGYGFDNIGDVLTLPPLLMEKYMTAAEEIGAPEGHHDLSHHGKSEEKQAKVQKINLFHMQHFAYLLDHFANVDEGGGKLLDNCMILYGSGSSDGDRHNHDDLPILMAGKAGGKIKKGAHWRFPKDTPLCDLYLWMLNQAGVKADSFGDSKGVLKFS